MNALAATACINGIALHRAGDAPDPIQLRQRACAELLRQAAICAGLLDGTDTVSEDGILSAAASAAIEALLDRTITVPEPTADLCRHHYAAHAAEYAPGERLHLRHILFAVTPGVDVEALRGRAESCLLDVRCRDAADTDKFATAARTLSNCPSGARGGDLGWLTADDCAPELAKEVFSRQEIGVLPQLVRSRFGLHVIEIADRERGTALPFEAVRGAIAARLRQQAFATALRQYLDRLACAAEIEGMCFEPEDVTQ